MKDYNLERYSDKVWQGGRRFGREQAIDEMLEIIGRYEESLCETMDALQEHMNQFEKMGEEMRALKGGEEMTEKQRMLICTAREKLHTAINHTGDYEDDEISELIEEAIHDIVAAALQGGDK